MPLKLTIETDGAVWACDWNECLMKWGITAILWNFQTVMHQATRPQHESSAWYLLTVLHLLNVVTFYWCGRRFLFMIEKEIICEMTNNWYLNWRIENIGWVSHVEIYRLRKGHDRQSFDSGHETSETIMKSTIFMYIIRLTNHSDVLCPKLSVFLCNQSIYFSQGCVLCCSCLCPSCWYGVCAIRCMFWHSNHSEASGCCSVAKSLALFIFAVVVLVPSHSPCCNYTFCRTDSACGKDTQTYSHSKTKLWLIWLVLCFWFWFCMSLVQLVLWLALSIVLNAR